MADPPSSKSTPESELRFPAPSRRQEQPIYRRPGPVAPEPRAPEKPRILVSRPEPPAPVAVAELAAKKRPERRSTPVIGTSPSAVPWMGRFIARHPRRAGALILALNAYLFVSGALSDGRALRAAELTGDFSVRLHRAVFFHLTAAAVAGGLWLLVFGIATDDREQIADWWKVGIAIGAILAGGFGAQIAQAVSVLG